MMKKAVCLVCAALLGAGAAFGGMFSEDPGELSVSGLVWIPGEGDADLFESGFGAGVSYREWFHFPWGAGINLGVAQWQVDEGASTFKYDELTEYQGDATLLPVGAALYFNVIDWDNWNLVAETGLQYVFVDSNVEVYHTGEGRWLDVDIEGSALWHFGLEFEYMLSEDLYVQVAAGYQTDVVPADTDYAYGSLRDTHLHGAYGRLGAKFLF